MSAWSTEESATERSGRPSSRHRHPRRLPGRLEDLIAQNRVQLDDVDCVVVDEADRMADMGFLPAVKRLLDRTPKERQTVLFSATLDGDVATLTSRYQRDPVRHEVGDASPDITAAEHLFWKVAAPTGSRSPLPSSTGRRRRSSSVARTRRRSPGAATRPAEASVQQRSTVGAARRSAPAPLISSTPAGWQRWWPLTWPHAAFTSTGSQP